MCSRGASCILGLKLISAHFETIKSLRNTVQFSGIDSLSNKFFRLLFDKVCKVAKYSPKIFLNFYWRYCIKVIVLYICSLYSKYFF